MNYSSATLHIAGQLLSAKPITVSSNKELLIFCSGSALVWIDGELNPNRPYYNAGDVCTLHKGQQYTFAATKPNTTVYHVWE